MGLPVSTEGAVRAAVRSRTDTAEAVAGASAPAAKAARAKRAEASQDSKGETKLMALIVLVAKLALGSAREVAMIKSIVLIVFTFEKAAVQAMVDGIKMTTTQYTAAVKQLPQGQKGSLGSPHLFVFDTFIQSIKGLCASLHMETLLPPILRYEEEINKKVAQLEADGTPGDKAAWKRMAVQSQVRVFRVIRCWNQDLLRVEANFVDGVPALSAFEAAMTLLTKVAKGSRKTSQAPKGDLERKISKALDDMGHRKGKGGGKGGRWTWTTIFGRMQSAASE